MKFLTLIIFTLYILHCTFYISPVLAQDSTSSSQPSSPSSDLKMKMKALQDEIASKASKLKLEITKKLQNKAYIGFIKSKSDTSITIATKDNIKIINVNEYTQYSDFSNTTPSTKGQKKPGKLINLKNFEADDYIVALGDVDETSVLSAKKIIRHSPPQTSEKQVSFGEVISNVGNLFKIHPKEGADFSFSTDSKTIFRAANAGEIEGLSGEIPPGKQIIVAAAKSQDGTLKARFIYLLYEASSSAQPKRDI